MATKQEPKPSVKNDGIQSALVGVAMICDRDAADMYDFLVRVGIKRLRLDHQLAHDLAVDALIDAIENDWKDPAWLVVRLRRRVMDHRRTARFRADNAPLSYTADNEPVELSKLASIGNQDSYVSVRTVLRALEEAPTVVRETMYMIALEWTPEEIAKETRVPIMTVRNRIYRGREIVQNALGVTPRDKARQFRGVDKQGNRFRAKLRVKQGRKWVGYYLGMFETAEDAARAYDEAALQHLGSGATLNFPRGDA